ncbi:MAG: glycosyltransferase family 1 protein [Planctomycetota bacterium]|nr:MAG: glycosyltransferase family 1 protein [Planctomycetota bacterium]
MNLTVGFDVTSAVKRRGRGIAAYVRSLLDAFSQHDQDLTAHLYIRDRRWLRRRFAADLLPQAPRHWMLGPLWSCPRELQVFHGLGVHLPANSPVPRSFTLHDLRGLDAVEFTHPRWREIRTRRLQQTVERADGILCLSEHGRQRLHHHFPEFPLERTAVVPHGLDHQSFRPASESDQQEVREKYELPAPFLLQVGRLDRHKNPETAIQAFAASRAVGEGFQLVFLGGAETGYVEQLQAMAQSLGVDSAVHFLGSVPFDELPVFYSASHLVLVPSYYEGFGMPVLEAMACGAAGLVSQACCLPEVAGEAWPALPAAEPQLWAAEFDALLFDQDRRHSMSQAALARAAGFRWQSTAAQTLKFLQELAS